MWRLFAKYIKELRTWNTASPSYRSIKFGLIAPAAQIRKRQAFWFVRDVLANEVNSKAFLGLQYFCRIGINYSLPDLVYVSCIPSCGDTNLFRKLQVIFRQKRIQYISTEIANSQLTFLLTNDTCNTENPRNRPKRASRKTIISMLFSVKYSVTSTISVYRSSHIKRRTPRI